MNIDWYKGVDRKIPGDAFFETHTMIQGRRQKNSRRGSNRKNIEKWHYEASLFRGANEKWPKILSFYLLYLYHVWKSKGARPLPLADAHAMICLLYYCKNINMRFRYSFICQGTSTKRQRRDLFGLRVKPQSYKQKCLAQGHNKRTCLPLFTLTL